MQIEKRRHMEIETTEEKYNNNIKLQPKFKYSDNTLPNLNKVKNDIGESKIDDETFKKYIQNIFKTKIIGSILDFSKRININLKIFLSRINLLKNTINYKQKGPYIYCVVKMNLKSPSIYFFDKINSFHTGIYECTKELLIHYGEKDKNGKYKPLTIEFLNKDLLSEYKVIKFFYSKNNPENFINLLNKNEWTSERYCILNHNCIHCTNEYLILNNINPINLGLGKNIAYEYLCDKCCKELGRYIMYKYEPKSCLNLTKPFLDLTQKGYTSYESIPPEVDLTEYKYRCERCLANISIWKYDENWLKKSEEEENYIVTDMDWIKDYKEDIKKYEKIGEPLNDALIRVKIENLSNNIYAIVRKNLIVKLEENERNDGFVAIVSLQENKIIEYGNEKYNNKLPVLRVIDLEDRYLYHIVRTFLINKNINELFYSINLTPWKGNRYDNFIYNSYHFINIYLNKYNQNLFLRIDNKIFNSVFMHLCRECYKKNNYPDCYAYKKGSSIFYINRSNNIEPEDKYWWCWDCGNTIATFHYVGSPLNIKFNYLCGGCYFELAEPRNYIEIKNESSGMDDDTANLMRVFSNLLMANNYCERCAKFIANYKCIN